MTPESRTLAVVGTLVWDTLCPINEEPSEYWGGIAFSLAALEVALGPEWRVLPVVKVGSDRASAAWTFLESFPHHDLGAVVQVEAPQNHVTLRYRSDSERTEELRGGVGGWSAEELLAPLSRCDAVYLNFISGFELTLAEAIHLRTSVPAPVYADLHSLFLGEGTGRPREPRTLPRAESWLACFDSVQVNENEARLLESSLPTGTEGVRDLDVRLAPAASSDRTVAVPSLFVETRGPAGVRIRDRQRPGWTHHVAAASWGGTQAAATSREPAAHGPVTDPAAPSPIVDPTGCGDTWGASFFARLLTGDRVEAAARFAAAVAARKLRVRGSEALRTVLAQEPRLGSPVPGSPQ